MWGLGVCTTGARWDREGLLDLHSEFRTHSSSYRLSFAWVEAGLGKLDFSLGKKAPAFSRARAALLLAQALIHMHLMNASAVDEHGLESWIAAGWVEGRDRRGGGVCT